MPTLHEIYDQAVALKDSGDLEGAVGKLREVLEVDPDYLYAHSAMAVYLQRMGQNAEAVEHAKKVCEIAPDDPFSYTQLSNICVRCGMKDEAEVALEKARMAQAKKS